MFWPLSTLLALARDGPFSLLLIGTLLLMAVTIVIAMLLSRSLARLRQGAERFAEGDLSQRLAIQSPLQIAAVAESLNRMAEQMQERMHTLVQQRNELDAVLGSMTEGVLAIDSEERVMRLNPAAAAMLGVEPAQVLGRSIVEAVRNTSLAQFVAQTLHGQGAEQEQVVLQTEPEERAVNPAIAAPRAGSAGTRHFQAYGAALRDGSGQRIGALIVLHEITRLTRLEMVRRDFVANVSHEIKTPVTAIKAAVETILEGGASDPEVEPFLRIIARQADRLQAITEDLLSLARIEQEDEQNRLEMAPTNIGRVLQGASETCAAKAQERQISVTLTCEPELQVGANASLLEQAVVNLMDNAIKYSPVGSRVTVAGQVIADEVVIAVADHGPGIASEHLPRLFERFYRTDRARSRALGGTGLGLAIVKHIAQSHGGRVSVDSTLNRGSTFRIHLPRR